MKKFINIFMVLFFINTVVTVTAQNCTQCNNTTTGTDASAIGKNTSALGFASFASGFEVSSSGDFAFGHGKFLNVEGGNSLVLGKYAETVGATAMVIGYGYDNNHRLINSISNSLMIGFNSNKSTLFVGPSLAEGKTGSVGIGDITDLQAKLHIKADENEQAVLFIEPHTFSAANNAYLWMGTSDYGLRAGYHKLYFNTGGHYIFNSANANVGIGTINPLAKLQISDGDIFIEDIDRGIIMKSPDGQCWRGTLDNNGSLNFEIIDCSMVTSAKPHNANTDYSVNIYPNPSKGNLTVKITGNNRNLTIQFFDMTGNLIIARQTHNAKTVIKTKVLPSGNYIIKVSDKPGNIIHTEKITVL